MKQLFLISLIFLLLGCNSNEQEQPRAPIPKVQEELVYLPVVNQFQAVWNEVESDPLTPFPQETVSYSKLFDGAIDLITRDAQRTLSSNENIIAPFDKLAHPNGVCLSGIWKIDTSSPYSGYFKNGSESLVIARASTAMSETKRGETRAFGMAIKLFGTLDRNKTLLDPTANIFVIDDLGGTDSEYFTDVALTNEPDVTITGSAVSYILYAAKVASTFSDADENSGIRQLYEISYLGEEDITQVITPKWIKIEAQENQTSFGVDDFRDEFSLDTGAELLFNISVASKEVNGVKEWNRIGNIIFYSSVISESCDHRLHFHHPLWRDDLVYE